METTVINNIKIKFRPECDDWAVINEVFNEDVYRVKAIPLNSTVIDLGAHIGTFTLRASVERKCIVYAYEPFSDNFKLLQENVRLNKVQENVKLFKSAVAGREEEKTLFIYPKTRQSATLFSELISNPEKWWKEKVKVVTLKNIFENNKIKHCELLKMDIEGAEKEVITLKWADYLRRANNIIIEWHNYDGHLYAETLEKLGFSVLLTGTGVPQPVYDITFARGLLYANKKN